MFDPDKPVVLHGIELGRFIDEVREEFFRRTTHSAAKEGVVELNSLRVVTIEVFDSLSADAQAAVTSDLIRSNGDLILGRPADEIFAGSDSLIASVTDLVCEIAWQALRDEPLVRMEDDSREELAGT